MEAANVLEVEACVGAISTTGLAIKLDTIAAALPSAIEDQAIKTVEILETEVDKLRTAITVERATGDSAVVPTKVAVNRNGELPMADVTLDDVVTAMNAEDTEIDSAIAFIVSVPSLVAAAAASAGIDQTKAAALVADMASQTQKLADALVSGTPSAGSAPAVVTSMKKKLGIR